MTKRFGDHRSIEQYLPSDDEDATTGARKRSIGVWHRLERMVGDYPKQSLIAALAAGALLGWITKRR